MHEGAAVQLQSHFCNPLEQQDDQWRPTCLDGGKEELVEEGGAVLAVVDKAHLVNKNQEMQWQHSTVRAMRAAGMHGSTTAQQPQH